MIIRIEPLGRSFKGVSAYLTHDLNKAKTAERVDWTCTLNLASDGVGEAINEMYWTYRAADALKREAGLRAGGRQVEKPVKHFSLSWHPSENPTREEMIEAVQDFIRHMGWSDRQAVLVAHKDRPHDHVHVILNTISPIDGRVLDPGYEHARASFWALAYERERRRVLCKERLKPYGQREPAPTREAWQAMKEAEHAFDAAEAVLKVRQPDYIERHDPATWRAREWEALRSDQRDQRTDFFAGGKQAYREVRNSVFREVRTEFRPQWQTWFRMRREGADLALLGAIRDGILERQNAELEKRRDEACKELRQRRDQEYAELLQRQRDERAELKERQRGGLRTYDLLDRVAERTESANDNKDGRQAEREELRAGFRSAANETTQPRERDELEEPAPEFEEAGRSGRHRVKDPANAVGDLGTAAIGALADVVERLFDGFLTGGEQPRPRKVTPSRDTEKQPRTDNSARATERQQKADEAVATEAEQLHAYWEERKRRRSRERD